MLVGGKTIQHYICKYAKKGGSPPPGSFVLFDESSEIQLQSWVILAQWRLMGVHFIIMGDFDGQLKPICDKWAGAMDKHDIRKSQFLHDLAGGLRLNWTTYRRGEGPLLFKRFTDLYKFADLKPKKLCAGKFNEDYYTTQNIVESVRIRYPSHDGEIQVHCCRTHVRRIQINALVNRILAEKHDEKLFLPSPGKLHGAQMQPQDFYIWPGMELICYSRKYRKNKPINGGIYVVESFDDENVVVNLHDDYLRNVREKAADHKATPPSDTEDEDSDPDDLGEEDSEDDALEPPPAKRARKQSTKKTEEDKKRAQHRHELSHSAASFYLRPQHALVYASLQGRTLRNQHIALLDWQSPLFTVRHLIVAMSRATHGKFVHVLNEQEELDLIKGYQDLVRQLDE